MAAELTLGLELETGAWSFWRTEDRRRVRRGLPPEDPGWTFQVQGPAGRLCRGARVQSTLGAGAGRLGAGRCHDSDAGRLGAGAVGRVRAARGAPRSPPFQVSLEPEACTGAVALEEKRVGWRRLGRGE